MRHDDERVDAGAAERLDQALDGLSPAARSAPRPDGVANLALVAKTLQYLDAHDSEPDPAATFVRRLEEQIMRQHSVTLASQGPPVAVLTRPPAIPRSGVPATRSRGQSTWRRYVRLAAVPIAATVVLGLVATLLIAGMRSPSGDDERPALSAATESGTPAALREIAGAVDIAECDAEARAPGSVAALLGTPPTSDNALPLPMNVDVQAFFGITPAQARALLDVLNLASDEEASAVAETLGQLTACRFTLINPHSFPADLQDLDPYEDYDGVFYGLFSDDFFRRGLIQHVGNVDGPVFSTEWLPVGSIPPQVLEVRKYGDGRLVALVQDPGREDWYQRLVVFTEVDGRWLVDEQAQVTLRGDTQPSATPDAAPYSSRAPQYLEVTLREDAARIWTTPYGDGIFRAGDDVTITVANIGTVPHRFEIPAVGVMIDAPAGHSVSLVLNAPVGMYEYRSFASPSGTEEVQHLDGTFEFVPPGTPIPLG